MNTAEIIAELREKSPEAVQGLTDTALKKLVNAVLGVVRDHVADAQPGRIIVTALGRFSVKEGSKEVDGQKQARRKVGFQPAADKGAVEADVRVARKAARKSAKAEAKSA